MIMPVNCGSTDVTEFVNFLLSQNIGLAIQVPLFTYNNYNITILKHESTGNYVRVAYSQSSGYRMISTMPVNDIAVENITSMAYWSFGASTDSFFNGAQFYFWRLDEHHWGLISTSGYMYLTAYTTTKDNLKTYTMTKEFYTTPFMVFNVSNEASSISAKTILMPLRSYNDIYRIYDNMYSVCSPYTLEDNTFYSIGDKVFICFTLSNTQGSVKVLMRIC